MRSETFLFISNQKISSNPVLAAVKTTGHRVLGTTSTQAPAVLFIMRCVAAVLLEHCGSDETSLDLARDLRTICPQAPIILLSRTPINSLPPYVDAWVNMALPLTNLPSAVLRALAVARDHHRRNSLRQAS